ncbi:MAG: M23 family metallopeptidase [Candidatus Eisenbacteria bacterium]|nr:M23 family metallopeptidase [Candidatus Eisenbacteria bacterium]
MLPLTRIRTTRRPRHLPSRPSKQALGSLLLGAVLFWPSCVHCQELGPPLPSWFPITSTFCEYRPQHFHAGIDLSTGGRAGVPVLAVGRGHVQRVRVSGSGYGKAVYLLLDNGMTAVYGHLDAFSEGIQSHVLSEQLRSGQYEQDLFPPAGLLGVERGDTIGVSGDTGASSGPHLHFELRRADTALNPLKTAYSLADGVRPAFNYVRLIPVGPESEIDGACAPCVVRLGRAETAGVREATRVPRISGSFYVSASVFDRTCGASNRLAVYETRVFLDDSLVFERRFDDVDVARGHEVELVYDLGLARRGERFTLNLRGFEGATLPVARGSGPGSGVIDVAGAGLRGRHVLRVEAADIAGNRSAAVLRFLAGSKPSVESVGFRKNGSVLSVEARVRRGNQSGDAAGTERVWLRYDLWAVPGEPGKARFRPAASQPVSQAGEAAYVCEVELPACLEGVGLEGLAGEFRVWVEDEDGFDSAPYTECLRGSNSPAEVHAELEAERHKDFIEILANVTPRCVRPRIGIVTRDTVWLKVVEVEDGRYRARFRFSHLFSDGGTAVCVLRAGGAWVVTRSLPIPLSLVRKGTEGEVGTTGDEAAFRYEPDTFYSDAYLSIRKKGAGEPPPGLSFASDVFSFESGDVVFDKPGTVVIRCADEAAASGKVAVYGRESGSRWSYAGALADTVANTVGAQVRRLCDYALIRDEIPPSVAVVRPRSGSVTAHRTPPVYACVRDVGSGVEWKGMTVTVDGRKVLSAWDPRYSRLSVVHSTPLAAGRHRVVFEVRDRSGNLSVAETSFRVSR